MKLWCVLKPGLLLLYRSQKAKSSHWIGTIILSTCELIERPSKKDGFCFKLFHSMDQSVWASKGPEGESLGAVVQPLPTSHLIFRAPTNAAGKCWMDALELALRCSSLLTARKTNRNSSFLDDCVDGDPVLKFENDSDVEKHFKADLEDGGSVTDEGDLGIGDATTERSTYPSEEDESGDCSDEPSVIEDVEVPPPHTNYLCDQQEVFGTTGDQTEEFSDEDKSIVWFLVKQVRPGMDLSKVVLPTFILEPRSFLDKISDYYYHADILSEAIKDDSPFSRIKTIVKWYLSGFYKKPKGLKKPYNPILGERFRCYWQQENGSKTFYIAEQVSHHPPISAFYVTNREDGFTISASILAKSKFYGNSLSAILEGVATLSLLPRGEDYKLTMPYAHCKGILMGTMTMELGGKVYIECGKTGYSAELEFKLRPFLGGGEFTNAVSGKIKLGKETLATIDGHWDSSVVIKEKKTGSDEVLWVVDESVKLKRLPRFTVPLDQQEEFESANLWRKVSAAIDSEDQVAATEEKFVLEEAQRAEAKKRKADNTEWIPKSFQLEPGTDNYLYMHSDGRPWDALNDLYTYESDYMICTKTKHKTPMVRTQSIVSVSEELTVGGGGGVSGGGSGGANATPSSNLTPAPVVSGAAMGGMENSSSPGNATMTSRKARAARRRALGPASSAGVGAGGTGVPGSSRDKLLKNSSTVSGSSQDDCGERGGHGASGREEPKAKISLSNSKQVDEIDSAKVIRREVEAAVRPLRDLNRGVEDRLARLQLTLDQMMCNQRERDSNTNLNRDMVLLVILIVMIQAVLNWILTTRASQQMINTGGGSAHGPIWTGPFT